MGLAQGDVVVERMRQNRAKELAEQANTVPDPAEICRCGHIRAEHSSNGDKCCLCCPCYGFKLASGMPAADTRQLFNSYSEVKDLESGGAGEPALTDEEYQKFLAEYMKGLEGAYGERVKAFMERHQADMLKSLVDRAAEPAPEPKPTAAWLMCKCGHDMGTHWFKQDSTNQCMHCSCIAFQSKEKRTPPMENAEARRDKGTTLSPLDQPTEKFGKGELGSSRPDPIEGAAPGDAFLRVGESLANILRRLEDREQLLNRLRDDGAWTRLLVRDQAADIARLSGRIAELEKRVEVLASKAPVQEEEKALADKQKEAAGEGEPAVVKESLPTVPKARELYWVRYRGASVSWQLAYERRSGWWQLLRNEDGHVYAAIALTIGPFAATVTVPQEPQTKSEK